MAAASTQLKQSPIGCCLIAFAVAVGMQSQKCLHGAERNLELESRTFVAPRTLQHLPPEEAFGKQGSGCFARGGQIGCQLRTWRKSPQGMIGRRGLFGSRTAPQPQVPAPPPLPDPQIRFSPIVSGILLAAVVFTVIAGLTVMYIRRLRRPYKIFEVADISKVKDPEEEMCNIVNFIQDDIIGPIDKELPGSPFRCDLYSFPMTPMVLVIGNHSSGKSTFINSLLGTPVQETGVAPTDDGFTILERAEVPTVEDGPTVLGCPENRCYRDLQRFGDAFTGSFRRKRVVLPDDAPMPFGLQIVDTPGMIDTPGGGIKGRGYDFVAAVRWWAKRADAILILFDPDKPGTTGESLEVLTKSLQGFEHKFRILLNKVDRLASANDYARAYGTLGWALSKVIARKDIPLIYPTYSEGFQSGGCLALEEFAASRKDVVEEVFRAKERHYGNVLTTLEQTLWQVEMMAIILKTVRARVWLRFAAMASSVALLGIPAPFIVLNTKAGVVPGYWIRAFSAVILLCAFGAGFLLRLAHHLQQSWSTPDGLDAIFRREYGDLYYPEEREDHNSTWRTLRPRLLHMLRAAPSRALTRIVPNWRLKRVRQVLNEDMWYLRQLARAHRASLSLPVSDVSS